MSAVSAIIVGAGFGGLASAIELKRKGCDVKVFEAAPRLTDLGDGILLAPNATRILGKWGTVLPKLTAKSAITKGMRFLNTQGELLLDQALPADPEGFPNFFTHRGETCLLMFEHAKSLGIDFTLNTRVTRFFEDENLGGIEANGKEYTADLVIAADGVNSKARDLVLRREEQVTSSGFAIYRSWFPLQMLRDNPKTAHLGNVKEDFFHVWIGDDVHVIIATDLAMDMGGCWATHKDLGNIEESWTEHGSKEEMLKVVQGWDETLTHVVNLIPADKLVDFKLLWRDPFKEWISPCGRIALVGDAAHPHLATSGNGGAQALEDGTTLGVVIQHAGKSNIHQALKAYSRLRYERTSLTQRMGWETRRRWHQTDWESFKLNPDILKLPFPSWLMGMDAEVYAEANYDAVVSHLETGTPFTSTNVPPNHLHEDWTVASLLAMESSQQFQTEFKIRNEH